jgi:hypothetical protein
LSGGEQVRVTRSEPKVHRRITTPEDLLEHLQWALCVELSTIPPYLCALYSIADTGAPAYALIRSVVVEEMLHMALVSNLMNAIGGRPSLAPKYVPLYPGYMKHHAAGGPFIQLQPLSQSVAKTVFMAIEAPESSPKAPAEGEHFHTIGQFYKAVEEGFETCADRYPDLFEADTGFQRADTYFGGGGGELVLVHDLLSAKQALTEITEQGEGAPEPHPPLPGEERFGDHEYYGTRLDATYGPILGTPWELSHYRKFQQLADGEVALPSIYPMQANPSSERLSGSTKKLAELTDSCYTLVLRGLERLFTSADAEHGFFTVAFPVMQAALPRLCALLMQTPLELAADPTVGPTAGPAFLYHSASVEAMVSTTEDLQSNPPDLQALPPALRNEYRQGWIVSLQAVADTLRSVLDAGGELIPASSTPTSRDSA